MADIILGSGKLYMVAFDSATGIPADATFEVDTNSVGTVKGGASVSYKPTTYTVEDDNGRALKRFVTKEEVTLKSGVITFNLETLSKIAGASEYADDTTAHKRTMKVGGRGINGLTAYAIRFVHTKADGNKLRCTIVGTNEAGLQFSFNPDKETNIDCEWTAIANDDEGTLVIFEDSYTAA